MKEKVSKPQTMHGLSPIGAVVLDGGGNTDNTVVIGKNVQKELFGS